MKSRVVVKSVFMLKFFLIEHFMMKAKFRTVITFVGGGGNVLRETSNVL